MFVVRSGWAAALPLLLLAGCGGSHGADAGGTVTLDGQAIQSGAVSFHPTGGGAIATGTISADGRYQMRTGQQSGLAPGEYRVTVVATGEVPAGDEEVAPPLLTPPEYGNVETTPLTVQVQAGSNTIPIDLTGSGG